MALYSVVAPIYEVLKTDSKDFFALSCTFLMLYITVTSVAAKK